MILSALTQLALAQSFSIHDATMLEPVPGTWYEAGMGSPSVVYRKQHDDYVMFFETMLAPPDASCKQGFWGVGVAVSDDGRSWTVAPSPLMQPQAGTFRSCVIAHPYGVIADNGSDIHLWYKAEQPRKACKGLPAPLDWGCDQYTGVGYAKVGSDLQTLLQDEPLPVVSTTQTFGYPAVTKVDGVWYMMLARVPDFYLATSTAPDSGWVFNNTPVLTPGVTSWSNDELYNPAIVCDERNGAFPFRLFFGGRNIIAGAIVDGGWGDAISTNASSWLVNAQAYFSFLTSPDLAWRHIDAMKVGPETVIYFSEKNAAGINHIGRAGTTDTWIDWRVESRQCPQPAGWFEILPGTDLVDALDDLRDLFLAELPSGTPAVDTALDKGLVTIDDAFGEVAKGHPHHLGDDLRKLVQKLQELETATGFDTDFLQQAAASVSLHGLRELLERVESVEGPTSQEVIDGQAGLDLAEAAYAAGDWFALADAIDAAANTFKNPSYAGDFCPTVPVATLTVILCDVQGIRADVDALAGANPGERKLREARDKVDEALEALAEGDVEQATTRLFEASGKLADAAPVDVSAEQAALAAQGSILARDYIDDAITWGDAPQADLDEAELFWFDGEAAYANGDYEDASDFFAEAVTVLAP